MKSFWKLLLKGVSTSIIVLGITACAAPTTPTIEISKQELKAEQKAQIELSKKYKPKDIKRKHKDKAIYESRLKRVAQSLDKAAAQLAKDKKTQYQYKVIEREGLLAYTDGKTIHFTPHMLDFLETDKELATVLSHELAHNIMGHHTKQKQNAIMGTIVDIVAMSQGVPTAGVFQNIGSMAHSQGFENEADYVGMYILARANYDINNVQEIWRKLTIQTKNGTKSSFFSSHPSHPERYIRIKKTIEEIKQKKKEGKELKPNLLYE